MDRADIVRKDSSQTEASKYYGRSGSSDSNEDSFFNLDDSKVLRESMESAASSLTRNFVLDFSDEEAYVAFDLGAQSILDLLKAQCRPEELNTRWINLFYPSQHKQLLEMIGKHYDFSPRLLAMMCSDPRTTRSSTTSSNRSRPRSTVTRVDSVNQQDLSDVEKGTELPDIASMSSNNPARTGNVYEMADDIWNYTSVDQGRNFLCIGYNSIYNIGPNGDTDNLDQTSAGTPLPHCKRVWTWLLLCENRTVITINEDPFPYNQGTLTHMDTEILLTTRRNVLNVFRSLSSVQEPASASPMTLLPIRKRLGSTIEETIHRPTDAPGLLFYYLFENWFNSYSLVTRRDSRYGRELDAIRAEMFEAPKLRHIDRLDRVGKQLGVLKRHYESYIRIIERVTQPQIATVASLANSKVQSKASSESLGAGDSSVFGVTQVLTEAESLLGVSLSSAARVRFERLKDIISLYALSEVLDYLAQKESLVQMVRPTLLYPAQCVRCTYADI